MTSAPRILITGAAGNLGSLLARHLARRGRGLRLMYHRKPLPAVSHWGDTRRARAELLPQLRYRSLDEGLETL